MFGAAACHRFSSLNHADRDPLLLCIHSDHYRSICAALDIGPRFSALNEKLNHCENLLEVLRALLTEGSSHRMELIIIYLIAFEATIALISHDYIPTPQRILNLLTGRVEEPKEEEGGKLEESVAALRKLLAMPRGGSETETHARIPPSPDAAAAAASRAQANVRLV